MLPDFLLLGNCAPNSFSKRSQKCQKIHFVRAGLGGVERDKCPHQNSSLWIREKNFMFPISRQEIQYYYDYFPSTTKLQFLSVANDVTHSPCQKKLGNCKHTDEIWHDAGQYNSWIHWQIAIIGLMQSLAESMEKPPETVKLIRNFWDWKLCKHCLAQGKKNMNLEGR